jgi:hypothetical protein
MASDINYFITGITGSFASGENRIEDDSNENDSVSTAPSRGSTPAFEDNPRSPDHPMKYAMRKGNKSDYLNTLKAKMGED